MNGESARSGALPHNAQKDRSLTATVLGEVVAFIRRYVVLSEMQCVAVALWVLHTHALDGAHATPYISITSAEKACGKTRLLEVLEQLVARPWFTGRTTAAALTRKTDAQCPTLLLDESDAAFKGDRDYAEALRGVLNTGYRRGGKVTLCVGQGSAITTRDFSTFGPKAIAGIGELPDTVASRSIPVRLKRRGPGEHVERWRGRRVEVEARPIREQLAEWASIADGALTDAEPEPVGQLGDRAAEVWEPLLSIADLAGEDWPQLARDAACVLSGRTGDDGAPSRGVQVLGAVKDAIGTQTSISTETALDAINSDDDLPFGGWREGKGLDARGLAKILRAYGIKSRTVRDGRATPKGYARADLEDAFARYLRPSPESPPQAPHRDDQQTGHGSDVADVADVADRSDGTQRQAPGGDGTLPVCAYVSHAAAWRPHPITGRAVCWTCHPPAAQREGGDDL